MIKKTKHLWIFCAGLMVLLNFSAVSEAGDCFSDCMNAASCSGPGSDRDGTFCRDSSATCSSRCLQSSNNKSYGAIAYSAKNGAYGYSDSREDRKRAEKAALSYCSEHGKGCKVEVWFYNSCGAVAADKGTVGWGQASSIQKAEQQALNNCNKGLFKKHCEVKASHCSR